jgi:hypothetical protein
LRQLGMQVEVFELHPRGFHRRGGASGSVDVGLLDGSVVEGTLS